jgi:beta-glucanase (GH16 family)
MAPPSRLLFAFVPLAALFACSLAAHAEVAVAATATSTRPTSSPCGTAAALPSAPLAGSWVVTFEDDFNGTELNTSSWTPSNYSSVISEFDGHDALFVENAISVGGGVLTITTAWDPQEFNGVHYNFTSGWVDSQQKINQTYGRFEASIKMPVANSTGTWPAYWLLPERECWPVSTEIDIVEFYQGQGHNQHSRTENPAQMSSSFHYGYGCGDDLYHVSSLREVGTLVLLGAS